MVLDLDNDDLRFIGLGDVEQLISVVAAKGKYLVFGDTFEVQDFTKMLNLLENVVFGTGFTLGILLKRIGVDSVDLLEVPRVSLRNLCPITHDVGYQELLALLIEVGIEKLNLVVIVNEEVLLVMLLFTILIIILSIGFLDHDGGIFRLVENVLIVVFEDLNVPGGRVVVKMEVRVRVDQDEDQDLAIMEISSDVVKALDLLRQHQGMIMRVRVQTFFCRSMMNRLR